MVLLSAEACKEHLYNTDLSSVQIETLSLKTFKFGKDELLFVNQLDVPKSSSENIDMTLNKQNSTSIESNTDLVSGVYEGGFKIWECSYDLLSYLQDIFVSEMATPEHVIDLGCGSGLPGIYCALNGANSVVYQDYNADVINGVTMPNYMANFRSRNDILCKPKFISGPWDTFCTSIGEFEKGFDLILTSETIYNTSHYSCLIDIFDFSLSLNGKVLLAAKVNYFGVGGGLREFEKALDDANKKSLKWTYKSVKVIEENVKREIIEIKRKM